MKPRKSAICHVVGFRKGNGHRERLGALLIEEKVDGVFNGATVFVEPIIRIKVAYFEETEAGHFRFPVFKRIVEK